MPVPRPSFAVVLPTVYGSMIVNRYDINQTNALLKTGAAIDHAEIALLAQLLSVLGTDRCVLDVGANFGTYALGLASVLQPGGKIHAFEAQRMIFNMSLRLRDWDYVLHVISMNYLCIPRELSDRIQLKVQ